MVVNQLDTSIGHLNILNLHLILIKKIVNGLLIFLIARVHRLLV